MMEAVRTSETSVDNRFTRQYIPEENSEHHTRRRENLKCHEGKRSLALYNELKSSWEREKYIDICTFEERKGTGWWKMDI
jgi:hypothetical protein